MNAVRAVDLAQLPTLPSLRVARFFERRLRHGKGQWAGQPFRLEPWQLDDFVTPVFDSLRSAPGGRLVREVQEAMLGVAKKNGKTHLGAGLGAYGAFADGHYRRESGLWSWQPQHGAEVYNLAGSREQAKILFNIAEGFVLRDPYLRSMARVYKDAIEIPETESVWRVLASDAKLAHGPNPSLTIIDEIWVLKDPHLYEAFASSGAAQLQPLLVIITTAGFDQESIAYQLYDRGRRRRSRSFYFKWFQAPDKAKIDDRKGWRAANPSRWVTPTYLKRELERAKAVGTESEFVRFHTNRWTSAREQAFPMEIVVPALRRRAKIPAGVEAVVAVDSAPKRDSTGIVIARKDDTGRIHARVRRMVVDPETGYLDYPELENVLRELHRTFELRRIFCDPFNMTRSMLTLAEEGLPIEEFPQGDARMVPASMNLYELFVADRMNISGDVAAVRSAVMIAEKQITERGWRLSKRKSRGWIDVLIALAMDCYELERGEEEVDEGMPVLFV